MKRQPGRRRAGRCAEEGRRLHRDVARGIETGSRRAPEGSVRRAPRGRRVPVPVVAAVRASGMPSYRAHLTTDRPVYRSGEALRFRSVTLDCSGFTPPAEDLHVTYTVTRRARKQ